MYRTNSTSNIKAKLTKPMEIQNGCVFNGNSKQTYATQTYAIANSITNRNLNKVIAFI